MSQQQQSHTPSLPSWKLNLTQQFNQASSYKNNNNNNNNKHQNNNKNKPTINNFDQQLQQRLTNIIVSTNHHNLYKEQLSSQKSQQQQQRQRQRQTIKINNNNKKDKERNNNNINFNEHLMQPNSSNSQANSNTTNIGRNYNICYYDSIFTNDKVAKLFNKHFGNYNDDQKNKQIRLQQFVNILCMQYLGQQKIQIKQLQSKITNDIKKALVQECRLIFCTTDQHTISLNAIQLLTKKNDLKLIILQLLLKIKYQKRKQKLQLKYQKILQSIIQQQQQIQKQQQKLANKRHKVQAQQRQLKKMLQKIKLQQKQLVEREKQTKKFLQEKYNKLSQQLKQVYDKMYKQIEKKANVFQRNAKNKLELIEKRRVGDNKNSNNNNNSNSKNTYNNNTNNNNEQPITSSITSANHKLNNELIIIKSKLKKAQNQLLSTKTARDRQIKQLQNESNSLLKINTMLQSKLDKSKAKISELSQCIVKIQRQLQSYKQEVREKNRQVIKLQSQLLEKQHVISSNNIGNYYEQNNLHIQQKTQHKHIRDYALQQKYRENHQQGTMKLSYNNSNTNNINDNSNYVIGQQYQQQLTIITITNNTNHIVRLLMQAFNDDNHKFNDDNHKDSNNNITKVSSPSHNIINPTTTIHTTQTKIQQALINQSTDIIVACGNIFWSVVNHISQLKSQKQSSQLVQQQFYQKINISHLLEFVIKLFMAKFSFIKFQSLMIMRRENSDYPLVRKSQQQLEQFVEDVSTKTARGREGQQINNCFNLTMQQKIKATSIFMSLSQSSLQQQLYQQQNNLYQQKLQTHLNLYITLLILGINQTFNFKTGKLQPIIKKILNLLTNHMSSTYKFFVNKFYDQQLMTFLLWKYMSYGVGIGQVSTFMDVLIQLCNNTHQQYQQNITTTSTSNRLFKTIYALENYKCFINFLLLNFTQKHNLSKNNILLKQTLQKVSIILQRFCYCYRGKLNVIEEDIRRLRKIVKQISSNRQFDESMFKANMVSILQAIEQYNNQQEDQYHNEQ